MPVVALPPVPTIGNLKVLFENLISVSLQLFGIVFFLMLLVGGFKYLTAGDDSNSIQGARKTLTYAIGGLMFILVSYMILRLIGWITGAQQIHFFRTYLP